MKTGRTSKLMKHSLVGEGGVTELECAELPDLEAAREHALKVAHGIMAANIRNGKLNLNECVVVEDECGNIVHTVRLRDIVAMRGQVSN